MFHSSGVSPQVTSTAGRGLIMVPGFQLSFISVLFFYLQRYRRIAYRQNCGYARKLFIQERRIVFVAQV
jgi:hypothetical protein